MSLRPTFLVFELQLDASPCGVGGVLWCSHTGQALQYFDDAVTGANVESLGVTVGDCAAQSIVEALAVFVGIRVWGHLMKGRRLHLQTRTDNAAALALQGKLASSTPALIFLGAELAIELEVLGEEGGAPRTSRAS